MFINDIKKSRKKRLVPDNKFDRHMKQARLGDINSRKKIFSHQTEVNDQRQMERMNLHSSTY